MNWVLGLGLHQDKGSLTSAPYAVMAPVSQPKSQAWMAMLGSLPNVLQQPVDHLQLTNYLVIKLNPQIFEKLSLKLDQNSLQSPLPFYKKYSNILTAFNIYLVFN